jgi:coenzyme F420-reducing hydrogenase alpha subunit
MSDELIDVPILTRVEGEGALTLRLRDGKLVDAQLRIYEPPRLFEALLRGRPLEDAPDITARICGICPVAYQMSAVHALEMALGVTISPDIRRLRRLLYCGEWIESHVLHMHLLQAPDFFGASSGIELAKRFPADMTRGLRLKKIGNQLLEMLGGRAIHPINVAVGGFYRWPKREDWDALVPLFEQGLEDAKAAARWVATFSFPDFEQDYESVCVTGPGEYPFNEGDIAIGPSLTIPVTAYETHFTERHVAHSTALQSVRIPGETTYLVGPLARMNIERAKLLPHAARLADEIGFEQPCRNPFRGIVARGIEVVQAYEEALAILRQGVPRGPSRIDYAPRAGQGCAATEAPRGLLYHHYEIDDTGKIVSARIIPPTSQNQGQIETDLRAYATRQLAVTSVRDVIATDCERLVRCYDPCISCSTHFLKVRWEDME